MSLPFDSFEFSTEKKMHNVRVMRMAAWETAPHIALRNCSKEMGLGVGRQYICDFGKGGVHAIKHVFFVESFCWFHKAFASHEKQLSP